MNFLGTTGLHVVRHSRAALGAVSLAAFTAMAQAPTDVRVALVIGNSAYAAPAALLNPANDAGAMSATLKTLGFTVVELRDGSLSQMEDAIERVHGSLRGKQGIGMLYYAGHGLQVDFHNYMVPVNAKLSAASDVPTQTVDLAKVIGSFKSAGNRMNIVVLDACRDNPFATVGTGRGLAPLDAPTGTFLAYATAPGNVAEDGDALSGNGLYTGFLIKELQRPASRIEDVFKRVRLQVRQKSQGRQIPWESTSLEDDFYFNDGLKHTFKAEDLERVAAQARQREETLQRQVGDSQQRERQDEARKALAAFQAAAAERRNELAQERAQAEEEARLKRLSAESAREEAFRIEKAAWDRIKDSRNPDDLYAFLQRYPSGFVTEHAQARLDQLQKALVQPQLSASAPAALPTGARRYYVGDVVEYDLIDGFTKNATRQISRVTKTTDDFVEFNGGRALTTQGGNLRKNAFGVHEPGVLLVPSELWVGKRWKTAFETLRPDGRKEISYWNFHVTALEDVTVPAGTFKAYKIEGTGEARRSTDFTYLTGTHWVDPATMLQVRTDRLFRVSGRITDYFSTVMVRLALVPRPS